MSDADNTRNVTYSVQTALIRVGQVLFLLSALGSFVTLGVMFAWPLVN